MLKRKVVFDLAIQADNDNLVFCAYSNFHSFVRLQAFDWKSFTSSFFEQRHFPNKKAEFYIA